MECKEAKKHINNYAYGEITHNEIDDLMIHLNVCKECSESFEQMQFVNDNIKEIFKEESIPFIDFRENVMREIKNRNQHKLCNKFKIKSVVAAILIVAIFIPVNGKSTARAIENWVKSLTLKINGSEYKVKTDAPLIVTSGQYVSNGEIINKEKQPKKKCYFNIDDARKNIKEKFIIPKYMTKGYEFMWAEQYEEAKNSIKLTYGTKCINIKHEGRIYPTYENIWITIYNTNLFNANEKKYKDVELRSYTKGTVLKQVDVLGVNSYISKNKLGENIYKDLNIYTKQCIIFIDTSRRFNEFPDEELIKIGESILEQVKPI